MHSYADKRTNDELAVPCKWYWNFGRWARNDTVRFSRIRRVERAGLIYLGRIALNLLWIRVRPSNWYRPSGCVLRWLRFQLFAFSSIDSWCVQEFTRHLCVTNDGGFSLHGDQIISLRGAVKAESTRAPRAWPLQSHTEMEPSCHAEWKLTTAYQFVSKLAPKLPFKCTIRM